MPAAGKPVPLLLPPGGAGTANSRAGEGGAQLLIAALRPQDARRNQRVALLAPSQGTTESGNTTQVPISSHRVESSAHASCTAAQLPFEAGAMLGTGAADAGTPAQLRARLTPRSDGERCSDGHSLNEHGGLKGHGRISEPEKVEGTHHVTTIAHLSDCSNDATEEGCITSNPNSTSIAASSLGAGGNNVRKAGSRRGAPIVLLARACKEEVSNHEERASPAKGHVSPSENRLANKMQALPENVRLAARLVRSVANTAGSTRPAGGTMPLGRPGFTHSSKRQEADVNMMEVGKVDSMAGHASLRRSARLIARQEEDEQVKTESGDQEKHILKDLLRKHVEDIRREREASQAQWVKLMKSEADRKRREAELQKVIVEAEGQMKELGQRDIQVRRELDDLKRQMDAIRKQEDKVQFEANEVKKSITLITQKTLEHQMQEENLKREKEDYHRMLADMETQVEERERRESELRKQLKLVGDPEVLGATMNKDLLLHASDMKRMRMDKHKTARQVESEPMMQNSRKTDTERRQTEPCSLTQSMGTHGHIRRKVGALTGARAPPNPDHSDRFMSFHGGSNKACPFRKDSSVVRSSHAPGRYVDSRAPQIKGTEEHSMQQTFSKRLRVEGVLVDGSNRNSDSKVSDYCEENCRGSGAMELQGDDGEEQEDGEEGGEEQEEEEEEEGEEEEEEMEEEEVDELDENEYSEQLEVCSDECVGEVVENELANPPSGDDCLDDHWEMRSKTPSADRQLGRSSMNERRHREHIEKRRAEVRALRCEAEQGRHKHRRVHLDGFAPSVHIKEETASSPHVMASKSNQSNVVHAVREESKLNSRRRLKSQASLVRKSRKARLSNSHPKLSLPDKRKRKLPGRCSEEVMGCIVQDNAPHGQRTHVLRKGRESYQASSHFQVSC